MAVNKPARKFRPKRFQTAKWKPSDEAVLAMLSGLALLYFFFEPFTIGHDDRYFRYIILPPLCIGLVVFFLWKRQELSIVVKEKAIGIVAQTLKVMALILYPILVGLWVGFCIFGVPAMAVWDYCNVQAANKNTVEVIACPVTQFYVGKRCNISFTFSGHHEQISMAYKSMKQYKDENPDNYKVVVTCREGLWNYYVVEDWEVVRKSE